MNHTPTLTPDQERVRASVAEILEASPHAIVPCLLALSDAISTFDPRHQDAA